MKSWIDRILNIPLDGLLFTGIGMKCASTISTVLTFPIKHGMFVFEILFCIIPLESWKKMEAWLI